MLTVEDYLELKFRYLTESEKTAPVIKHTTDKKGNITRHIKWVKQKLYFPEEHNTRMETLGMMRENLVSKYNDISVCFC